MSYIERLRNLPLSRAGDRAPRFPCSIAVEASPSAGRMGIACRAVNISRSGILLEVVESGWPGWGLGSQLVLKLAVDGQYVLETLTIRSEVARVVNGPDGTVKQVALKFLAESR
jgi:hypothetical protein